MSNSSRFTKYRNDDLPALWKPEPGDSRSGRLVGVREHKGKNDDGSERVIPVLDLVDFRNGTAWSFMSGAWRWIEELELKDPQDGDMVCISRGPNIGQQRDYRLDVLERAAATVESDVPADTAELAPATEMLADDIDIPF